MPEGRMSRGIEGKQMLRGRGRGEGGKKKKKRRGKKGKRVKKRMGWSPGDGFLCNIPQSCQSPQKAEKRSMM